MDSSQQVIAPYGAHIENPVSLPGVAKFQENGAEILKFVLAKVLITEPWLWSADIISRFELAIGSRVHAGWLKETHKLAGGCRFRLNRASSCKELDH